MSGKKFTTKDQNMEFDNLSRRVIDCALEVHKFGGLGCWNALMKNV